MLLLALLPLPLPLLVLRQLETHSGKAAADVPSTIEIILQCDPAEAETISSLLFLSYIFTFTFTLCFFLFHCVFLYVTTLNFIYFCAPGDSFICFMSTTQAAMATLINRPRLPSSVNGWQHFGAI